MVGRVQSSPAPGFGKHLVLATGGVVAPVTCFLVTWIADLEPSAVSKWVPGTTSFWWLVLGSWYHPGSGWPVGSSSGDSNDHRLGWAEQSHWVQQGTQPLHKEGSRGLLRSPRLSTCLPEAGSCGALGSKRVNERRVFVVPPRISHAATWCRRKTMVLEAPGLPAVCPWTSDCTSLSLSFLLSKMEIIQGPASQLRSYFTEVFRGD